MEPPRTPPSTPLEPRTSFDSLPPLDFDSVEFTINGKKIILQVPNFRDYLPSDNPVLDETFFVASFIQLLSTQAVVPVCFYTPSIDTLLEHFFIVDFSSQNILISKSLVAYVKDACLNNPEFLIVLPVKLSGLAPLLPDTPILTNCNSVNTQPSPPTSIDDKWIAHSNLLIIDSTSQTIELFEPHGSFLDRFDSELFDIQAVIVDFVKQTFPQVQSFNSVHAAHACYGPGVQVVQSLANPGSGHCLAWSLLFLIMRLANYHVSPSDYGASSLSEIINTFLVSFEPHVLDLWIRRAMAFAQTSTSILAERNIGFAPYAHFETFDFSPAADVFVLEYRIKRLTTLYLTQQLLRAPEQDLNRSFKELSSYQRYPNYHTILFDTLCQFVKEKNICFLQFKHIFSNKRKRDA